jgi:hypothetical protein
MSSRMLATVYPPLAPGGLLHLPRRGGVFPFDRPELTYTHLGRGAVWLALRALELGAGKRIAMPAYHCGSEVEAARLAGLQIDFYRVDRELRVDRGDLERVAARCDAAYLISNFGFPPPEPVAGLPAIEDVAHGLFSSDGAAPLGSLGEAAVFCPRKSLGVADGGAVLVRSGRSVRATPGRPGTREMLRSFASLTLARAATVRAPVVRSAAASVLTGASRGDAAAREGELTATVIGEWDLEVADMEAAATRPAPLTEYVCRRADAEQIRAARRCNYELLAAELAELAPEPFRGLPAGVAPLYFPLRATDRDGAIARLLEHGVRPLEIWPLPHPLLDRERFSELEPARRELLALPVHQSLGRWQMERVLAAAKAALA